MSIMPLNVYKGIGVTIIDNTNTTLHLANWSTIVPTGIAKEVQVLFQGHLISTDFLIIYTGESHGGHIIFGRPFLYSIKAEINFLDGILDFNIGRSGKEHRIWRDPQFTVNGKPFNLAHAEFFMNLVENANGYAVKNSTWMKYHPRTEHEISPGERTHVEILRPEILPPEVPQGAVGEASSSHGKSRTRTIYKTGIEVNGHEIDNSGSESEDEWEECNEHDPRDIHTTTPVNDPVL